VTDELAFSMNGNNAHFGAPISAALEHHRRLVSPGSASAVSWNHAVTALGF
jgi:amidase